MNELKRHLDAGDPLLREPELSTADIERIRRVVLGSVGSTSSKRWPGVVVALACSLATVVGASVWIVRDRPAANQAGEVFSASPSPSSDTIERRQVQFSTPGGTRVIWVLETNAN